MTLRQRRALIMLATWTAMLLLAAVLRSRWLALVAAVNIIGNVVVILWGFRGRQLNARHRSL